MSTLHRNITHTSMVKDSMADLAHHKAYSLFVAAYEAGVVIKVAIFPGVDPIIEYSVYYPESFGTTQPIFEGRLESQNADGYTDILQKLRGHVVSEICPPTIRKVTVDNNSSEVHEYKTVYYWKRVLVVDHDITGNHLKSDEQREESVVIGQPSAVWRGYSNRQELLIEVKEGVFNPDSDSLKLLHYVKLPSIGGVVAPVFLGNGMNNKRDPSLGEQVEKARAENTAGKRVSVLPPILKPEEYSSLDAAAKMDYNQSIMRVTNSLIHDLDGVLRDGDALHEVFLEEVFYNFHAMNDYEIVFKQEGEKAPNPMKYMGDLIGLSTALLSKFVSKHISGEKCMKTPFTEPRKHVSVKEAEDINKLVQEPNLFGVELGRGKYGNWFVATPLEWDGLKDAGQRCYVLYVQRMQKVYVACREDDKDLYIVTGLHNRLYEVMTGLALREMYQLSGARGQSLPRFTAEYFGITTDTWDLVMGKDFPTDGQYNAMKTSIVEADAIAKTRKAAVKKSSAIKRPPIWSLKELLAKSDLVQHTHLGAWKAYAKRAAMVMQSGDKVNVTAAVKDLRFLLSAGYMLERQKGDASKFSREVPAERYAAECFGLGDEDYNFIRTSQKPEWPTQSVIVDKKVSGKGATKTVVLTNRTTGASISIPVKKKVVLKTAKK